MANKSKKIIKTSNKRFKCAIGSKTRTRLILAINGQNRGIFIVFETHYRAL